MVAFAIPYLFVLAWVGGHASPYGSNNLALYSPGGRLRRLRARSPLTDAERALCPAPDDPRPPARLVRVGRASPGYAFRPSRANDPVLRDFALTVIRPAAVRLPARGHAGRSRPTSSTGSTRGPTSHCLYGRYSLPATAQDTAGGACHPEMAATNFSARQGDHEVQPRADPAAQARSGSTPPWRHTTQPVTARLPADRVGAAGPLAGPSAAGADAATVVARTGAGPERWPPTPRCSCWSPGAIIVLPVLVGMYEPRYALPAMPLVGLALGFASRVLSQSRRRLDSYDGTVAAPARPKRSDPAWSADSRPAVRAGAGRLAGSARASGPAAREGGARRPGRNQHRTR